MPMSERMIVVLYQLNNFSAISWWEQVNFAMKWWWGFKNVCHLFSELQTVWSLFSYKWFVSDILNEYSHTVYYIDCTLLFAIIKHLKKELVFHCWMLNDIFHYGDIGTEMSRSEMIFFISLSEISLFLSFSEILVFLSFSEILVFLSLTEILVFLSLSEILVFLSLSEILVFLPLSEILVFLSLSKILVFLSLSKICVFLSFVNLSISQTCNKHKTYKRLPD